MANLKFAAEICMRVRIPPPAPDSPSRLVPLIEERGDFFFRTRFAGLTTFCRRIGGLYSIRRTALLFGLAGSDVTAFLPAFPFRWAGRLVSRLTPCSSIRPIGFSHPSSPRFPPGGSMSSLSDSLYGRRGGCVSFVCIFVFHVDSAAACDTLTDIHAGVVERQTRQI